MACSDMSFRRRFWTLLFLVAMALGCWPGSGVLAQVPSDLAALRLSHQMQSSRVAELDSSRHEATVHFLSVAEAVVSRPAASRGSRWELLVEVQGLADRIEFLEGELEYAVPAVIETRRRLVRELEVEVDAVRDAAAAADPGDRAALEFRLTELAAELADLRGMAELPGRVDPGGADPLEPSAWLLSALAGVVEEERRRLGALRGLQDELRLFLGNLRLFDETGLPPTARGDGGGEPDPGCPVSSCPITGGSPGDVPLSHLRPEAGVGGGDAAGALTAASLARLHGQLSARVDSTVPAPDPEDEPGAVTRQTVVGVGAMGFRGHGEGLGGPAPRMATSLFLTWPLGGGVQLAVEPSLGGRFLRADVTTFAELAGEVRTTLAGGWAGGHSRWQVMAWQKGRYLSDPLPLPGYLEPGRGEVGMAGRLAVPVGGRLVLEAGGGGDVVRYGPAEWRLLNRQGADAVMGVAWSGEATSARLSFRGSRHGFGGGEAGLDAAREDTRLGVDGDVTREGRVLLRLSAGVAWNDSRLPSYDYRAQRTAVVLSMPAGRGSVQAYGALSTQTYLNPGSEGDRVAPSDHDTGSILALQYTRPLDATRAVGVRAEWSRGETGFQRDSYQRFGISAQLSFRGLAGT